MSKKKQKLELTWIGKDNRPKLEPRILIEDPELSHHAQEKRDGDIFDNLLIQGDNLLALKALEADFTGQIECVYIDPPFNTQQAFDNYDDGIEHSLWLSLMQERLERLNSLLSQSGTMFIHIDDNELGYLIPIADQIFGRKNRRYIITFKQGSVTGHKSINPGCVNTTNFVLIYSKSYEDWKPNNIFVPTQVDRRYNQFITNVTDSHEDWNIIPISQAYADANNVDVPTVRKMIKNNPAAFDEWIETNSASVVQIVNPDYDSVGAETRILIDESRANPSQIFRQVRNGYSDIFLIRGKRIIFYSAKMREIDGVLRTAEPLSTLWDDLLSNNLHKEGGVKFPKGKKPESLIKRCIELCTAEGDLVLDSFLGSGTTASVAHKLRRKWIGVELGQQALSHCLPRLSAVVDGSDQDGISKAVDWSGGGGFRFYRLAPSLLEKDKYGNWVISKEYNASMLAEAMCKNLGFTYSPSQDEQEYWRHGHSTETDFIFVTTTSMTHAALKKLSEDVGPDRTLLVCCKAFNADTDAFNNLTIKKIPHAVLTKCEWGKDDYSLNVANLPMAKTDEEIEEERMRDELPLFGQGEEE